MKRAGRALRLVPTDIMACPTCGQTAQCRRKSGVRTKGPHPERMAHEVSMRTAIAAQESAYAEMLEFGKSSSAVIDPTDRLRRTLRAARDGSR